MKDPCYKCAERHVHCHGQCQRYHDACAEREADREKRRKAAETHAYVVAQCRKYRDYSLKEQLRGRKA